MAVPLPFPLKQKHSGEPTRPRTGRETRVDRYVHIERDSEGLCGWNDEEVDTLIRDLKRGGLDSGLGFWQGE